MKSFSIIALAAIAFASVASAGKKHLDGYGVAPVGAANECLHGEFRCTTNATSRCNWGKWVDYLCPENTRCLEYGDWECIQLDRYEAVKAQILAVHSVVEAECIPPLSSGNECEHGTYRCSWNEDGTSSTDICNWGVWTQTQCPSGTKCIEYNDFECIALENYSAVEAQLIAAQDQLRAIYGSDY